MVKNRKLMFQDLKIVRARMALARKGDNAGFKNVLPVVGALGNQMNDIEQVTFVLNLAPLVSVAWEMLPTLGDKFNLGH